MLHIGQLIACTLHEQGRTVTWFARQLCCTRPNVYKIFGKENIDISLLWRISCILRLSFDQLHKSIKNLLCGLFSAAQEVFITVR